MGNQIDTHQNHNGQGHEEHGQGLGLGHYKDNRENSGGGGHGGGSGSGGHGGGSTYWCCCIFKEEVLGCSKVS